MREYHKIDTVFKRDPATKHKTLLLGDWSQDAFGYLANNEWVFTEKVDGTNIRVMVDAGEIKFGGKTDDAQIPAKLVQRAREVALEEIKAAVDRKKAEAKAIAELPRFVPKRESDMDQSHKPTESHNGRQVNAALLASDDF